MDEKSALENPAEAPRSWSPTGGARTLLDLVAWLLLAALDEPEPPAELPAEEPRAGSKQASGREKRAASRGAAEVEAQAPEGAEQQAPPWELTLRFAALDLAPSPMTAPLDQVAAEIAAVPAHHRRAGRAGAWMQTRATLERGGSSELLPEHRVTLRWAAKGLAPTPPAGDFEELRAAIRVAPKHRSRRMAERAASWLATVELLEGGAIPAAEQRERQQAEAGRTAQEGSAT